MIILQLFFPVHIEARRRGAGFSLVEMLVTLLIVAVLLGAAVPGLFNLVEQNRLQTTATRFMNTLMSARSEALKRNQQVVICRSTNGTDCATTGNWEDGWMTYADLDADGAKDAAEPIIAVHQRLAKADTLRVAAPALQDDIAYGSDGTASAPGVFVVCNREQDTTLAREIELSVTGRPYIRRTTSNCLP